MSTLERAIEIACEAHRDQVDKAGQPYVLHPLRLMMRMESLEQRLTAVLHDVVEDSSWTFEQLAAEGFAPAVVDAVAHLTRGEGESYEDFARRAGEHPIARVVKLADLEDNMNVLRLGSLGEKELERLARYHAAWIRLGKLP